MAKSTLIGFVAEDSNNFRPAKTQEADQVVFFSVSIPSGRGFWAGRREGAAQPRRLRESQSPLVGASGPA